QRRRHRGVHLRISRHGPPADHRDLRGRLQPRARRRDDCDHLGGDRDVPDRHPLPADRPPREAEVARVLKILRDLLRYNREFLAGAVLLGIILAMIGLSFLSPFDETTLYAVAPDMPPSLDHWFGTTSRGQDVFWQM